MHRHKLDKFFFQSQQGQTAQQTCFSNTETLTQRRTGSSLLIATKNRPMVSPHGHKHSTRPMVSPYGPVRAAQA